MQRIANTIEVERAGPQALATAVGVDKVLTSRLLKMLRHDNPIATVYHAPGPDPLHRFVRAAGRRGVPRELTRPASAAIDELETLIQQDAGDRSSLDAILAVWLPEEQGGFELRRKQSAFRAMSLLRGSACETALTTAIVMPTGDGIHTNTAWIMGMLGVHRLRPGGRATYTIRSVTKAERDRTQRTLDGKPLGNPEDVRLDEWCVRPPSPINIKTVGNGEEEAVYYMLGGTGFGVASATDFLVGQLTMASGFLVRPDDRVPFLFSEAPIAARRLVFDAFIHHGARRSPPKLKLHDTSYGGIVDPNDPMRDEDELMLADEITPLSTSIAPLPELPKYNSLLTTLMEKQGFRTDEFVMDTVVFLTSRCTASSTR